jgi:hypothetical protein
VALMRERTRSDLEVSLGSPRMRCIPQVTHPDGTSFVDRPRLPSEPKAPGLLGLSGVGPDDGVKASRERLCAVKADTEAMVSLYPATVPQPLEALTSEERYRLPNATPQRKGESRREDGHPRDSKGLQ